MQLLSIVLRERTACKAIKIKHTPRIPLLIDARDDKFTEVSRITRDIAITEAGDIGHD